MKGRCCSASSHTWCRSVLSTRSSSSRRSLFDSDPWKDTNASQVECFTTIRIRNSKSSKAVEGIGNTPSRRADATYGASIGKWMFLVMSSPITSW